MPPCEFGYQQFVVAFLSLFDRGLVGSVLTSVIANWVRVLLFLTRKVEINTGCGWLPQKTYPNRTGNRLSEISKV